MTDASEWRVPGYREESELGRGGSGRVVAAVEQASGDRVAVKYLADRLAGDEQFRVAFRGEAEILAALDLPHVVKVRRYVESADGAAIVMDMVTGVSLRRILARYGSAGPRAALSVLKGSLLGLAGAHDAGIVHRDYKPENVIVDAGGSSMLVDFGIALRAGAPGSPSGTPGYAAPEQWSGAPASPAGDIYAAAVTFAECVTGTEPPPGPGEPFTPGEAAGAQALGPRLAGLIERATAADPASRPADANALLAELQDAADDRFGADWEESGRSDLAKAAVALLALAAGAAAGATAAGSAGPAAASAGTAGTSAGPAATATTALTPARRAARAGRFGATRGIAIGAAAAVVIGAGIAVAVVTHHHPGPGSDGGQAGGGPTTGTRSAGHRHGHRGTHTARPSPKPVKMAANPLNPCTWLSSADFAKYGITTGTLNPGREPGGWRVCRNGQIRVGLRPGSPNPGACSFLPGCSSVSVPGATGGQYVATGSGIEIDAYRGGVEYAVAVPTGTASARSALLRLMELVLKRTAAT